MKRTIYISGIDNLVSDVNLLKVFGYCGKIVKYRSVPSSTSVKLSFNGKNSKKNNNNNDKTNSQSHFAFVEFETASGAEKAVALSGYPLGHYQLRITHSKSIIYGDGTITFSPLKPVNLTNNNSSNSDNNIISTVEDNDHENQQTKSSSESAITDTNHNPTQKTVHICNFELFVTDEELLEFFNKSCGRVVKLVTIRDPNLFKQKSPYGFVEFSSCQGAREAIRLSGFVVRNNPIRVCFSKYPVVGIPSITATHGSNNKSPRVQSKSRILNSMFVASKDEDVLMQQQPQLPNIGNFGNLLRISDGDGNQSQKDVSLKSNVDLFAVGAEILISDSSFDTHSSPSFIETPSSPSSSSFYTITRDSEYVSDRKEIINGIVTLVHENHDQEMIERHKQQQQDLLHQFAQSPVTPNASSSLLSSIATSATPSMSTSLTIGSSRCGKKNMETKKEAEDLHQDIRDTTMISRKRRTMSASYDAIGDYDETKVELVETIQDATVIDQNIHTLDEKDDNSIIFQGVNKKLKFF